MAFSEGTLIATFGLSMKPDFFKSHVNLVSLISPTLQFKHSSASKLATLAVAQDVMSTIAARENIYELFGEKSNGEAEVIANVKSACDKVGYISTDASADCNKFMDFVNSLTCMSKRTCKSQDGKDQFSVISHDLYDKERIGVMS